MRLLGREPLREEPKRTPSNGRAAPLRTVPLRSAFMEADGTFSSELTGPESHL